MGKSLARLKFIAEEKRFFGKLFEVVIFLMVAAWIGLGWFVPMYLSQEYKIEVGQIGDMFGAVNSLFSGVALVLVIYSLHKQRIESLEQRKVIREQQNGHLKLVEAVKLVSATQAQISQELHRMQERMSDHHELEHIERMIPIYEEKAKEIDIYVRSAAMSGNIEKLEKLSEDREHYRNKAKRYRDFLESCDMTK